MDTLRKSIRRSGVFLLFLSMTASAGGALALDLSTAIRTAEKNHPSLRAARERVTASQARVMQSASPFFPQVSASAGFAASESDSPLGDSITRGTTATVSANQLIYDFGRTGRLLDAAQEAEHSALLEQERVLQDVAMNVRQAYFGLLRSLALRTVAEKSLEQSEAHLKQAEAFFRAGSRPRFDVTRTEVEVNNARLALLNATNSVRLSRMILGNAMGVQLAADENIDDIPLRLIVVPPLENARRDALRNRPEMRKADSDRDAARSRVNAEKALHLPNLSAGGSFSWTDGVSTMGPYRADLGASWNAGVTLRLSVFEGGLTRGRVAEARAQLRAVEAERDLLVQAILLEVDQALADLENTGARLEVTEASLRKARENLAIAQGRYQAGVGPYIEVTDATLASLNAEVEQVQARYDYALAAARLEKAIGNELGSAAPPSAVASEGR